MKCILKTAADFVSRTSTLQAWDVASGSSVAAGLLVVTIKTGHASSAPSPVPLGSGYQPVGQRISLVPMSTVYIASGKGRTEDLKPSTLYFVPFPTPLPPLFLSSQAQWKHREIWCC